MSIRYINSNELIDDVPCYIQNIINNMDCVYIDGIKPNNQHFNLSEHDKKVRADAINEYRKEMHDMIEGNEEFTDWQKFNILECNELVAEQLKEQKCL